MSSARPQIAVINESTVLKDGIGLAAMAKALQRQVDHDFEPVWGIGAHLFMTTPGRVAASAWQLVFLDDADQAGALGYHDLTPDLQPLAKVFVRTTEQAGAKLSVTASHELLEMLADPHINRCAIDPQTDRLYAFENADAVEADELGYDIDGVTVSDFVLDTWFDPQARDKAGLRFDHAGHISEPFQLAAGGYISYLDLHRPTTGWHQAAAEHEAKGARPPGFPPGSRRERRRRLGKLKASARRER